MDIKIGKFTLESLTTGMYNDPKIIYREYVQNSVDSLEKCISDDIIQEDEGRIVIKLDQDNETIIIKDNGSGINSEFAFQTLTNIGDSNKRFDSNRGFRGIGRLGGLSYCDELVFITSAKNEEYKSVVSYNAKKLKKLLVPGNMDHMTLTEVINECVDYTKSNEKNDLHYFKVIMKGVDRSTDLLEMESVKDYLVETLPLPFRKNFIWLPKINENFEPEKIRHFNIFLEENNNSVQLYKAYKDKFIANSKSKLHDEIIGIVNIEVQIDGQTIAKGWYAKTNYLGGICDNTISGLRLRKGNILIGDGRTLDDIYRQGRFGIWTMGEIHLLDNNFIPNARRDGFEQNKLYRDFLYELKKTVGEDISKSISLQSKKRNDPISKEIKKASKIVEKIQNKLENGFNSDSEKKNLIKQATKSISTLQSNKKREVANEIVKELEQVTKTADKSNNYKLNISTASKKERKVLRIVSEVLNDYLEEETLNIIVEEIRDRLDR